MLALSAIADPTRRQILESLRRGEYSAGEIADQFEISGPAISQHLKILRETGLVSVRVDAQKRMYQLNPAGFAEIDRWLEQMRRFWSGRLDDLEKALRKPERKPAKPMRKKS